jgi:hypothetical protein
LTKKLKSSFPLKGGKAAFFDDSKDTVILLQGKGIKPHEKRID